MSTDLTIICPHCKRRVTPINNLCGNCKEDVTKPALTLPQPPSIAQKTAPPVHMSSSRSDAPTFPFLSLVVGIYYMLGGLAVIGAILIAILTFVTGSPWQTGLGTSIGIGIAGIGCLAFAEVIRVVIQMQQNTNDAANYLAGVVNLLGTTSVSRQELDFSRMVSALEQTAVQMQMMSEKMDATAQHTQAMAEKIAQAATQIQTISTKVDAIEQIARATAIVLHKQSRP